MAQRRKTGLTAVFLRYLVTCGACVALIAALWWFALAQLMRAGVVLPARTAADAAQTLAAQALESGEFEARTVPHYVRWARFTRDGELLACGGMDESHLRAAREELRGDSFTMVFPYMQYHRSFFSGDGSAIVLQFDYSVPYANASLQEALPDFQLTALALLLLAWLAVCALATRHWSRLLRRDADALMDAARAVAQQRLDVPLAGRARVREMAAALEAIEALRGSLSDSLKAQWAAQVRRQDELSALAHDLRTPLTAILARADLLSEETGDGATRESAQAIAAEAERIRTYVAALDGLWREESEGERAREAVPVRALFDGWRATGEALCAAKGVRLSAVCDAEGIWPVERSEIDRAVLNLLDNAARFTPEGGTIALRASQADDVLMVAVEDSGPGFSAEALRRAGYALYTGEEGGARGGHRGIGLCTARRTAERHGGALTLGRATAGGACAVLTIRR